MKYNLTIGWLYPDLMNIYGDIGNIICIQKRSFWHKIETSIKYLQIGFDPKEIESVDILLMGGAQDKQQQIVNEDLKNKRNELSKVITGGLPGLYVCGGYQFLGKYYKEADGTIIEGLGIFDIYTENPGQDSPRLIGNAGAKVKIGDKETVLIGFENHGGRTYLGNHIKPFGTVLKGFGNNGKDKTEGARLQDSFGTYLHGPLLPKNPEFADYLITRAFEHKYSKSLQLIDLNDAIESRARFAIANRMGIGI